MRQHIEELKKILNEAKPEIRERALALVALMEPDLEKLESLRGIEAMLTAAGRAIPKARLKMGFDEQ
jgi:hypothetical protein